MRISVVQENRFFAVFMLYYLSQLIYLDSDISGLRIWSSISIRFVDFSFGEMRIYFPGGTFYLIFSNIQWFFNEFIENYRAKSPHFPWQWKYHFFTQKDVEMPYLATRIQFKESLTAIRKFVISGGFSNSY